MQDGAWPSRLQLCRKPDGCSVMWTISRENAENSHLPVIEKKEETIYWLAFASPFSLSQNLLHGHQLLHDFGLLSSLPWSVHTHGMVPLSLWWWQWWPRLCDGRYNISCHQGHSSLELRQASKAGGEKTVKTKSGVVHICTVGIRRSFKEEDDTHDGT